MKVRYVWTGVALWAALCIAPLAAEKPQQMPKPTPVKPALAKQKPKPPQAKTAQEKTAPAKPDQEKTAKPAPSPAPAEPNGNAASPPPGPSESSPSPEEKPAPLPSPAETQPEPPAPPRVTRMIEIHAAEPSLLDKVLKEQFPGLKATWSDSGEEKKTNGPQTVVLSGPEPEVEAARDLLREMENAAAERQRNMGWVIYPIKQASPSDLQRILTEMFPEVSVFLGPQPSFLPGIPSFPIPTLRVVEQNLEIKTSQVDKEEDGRVSALILSGPREAVNRAQALLDQIDVPVPQVFIEVTVIDSNESFGRAIGVDWDLTHGGVSLPFQVGGDRGGDSGGILFGRLTTDPIRFNAQLQAAIVDHRVKLLANPKILAVNRRPAHIFIGDEINYAVSIQVTDKGTSVETERLRTGIQLDVFATASPDGTITLQLHPEVAALKQLVAVPGGAGVALPEISRRFTDTTVRLREGETLVIGGLISEAEQRSVRKVPLLGDLPLIGSLFRHTNRQRTNSEIIVFIRASSRLPSDPVREGSAPDTKLIIPNPPGG